jgi:hypothetical protein
MTVIAWDGKTLAADKMSLCGDTVSTVKKLWPLRETGLEGAIAVTGSLDKSLVMKRWYEEGKDRAKWPDFQNKDDWALIIVALPGFPVVYFEKHPEPIEVIDPFMAWGSGREAALGAMAMGADAIRAVEIASQHIFGCGRGCDFVMVNK